MLLEWRHCPQPWSSFNCMSLSFTESSVQLQGSAMMDVGTPPGIHTERLNSNGGEGKIKNLTGNRGILTQRRKLEHNAKWMEFQGEEGGPAVLIHSLEKQNRSVFAPNSRSVCSPLPAGDNGDCPAPRETRQWMTCKPAGPNNVCALLSCKEAWMPHRPKLRMQHWGAASPRTHLSVTWICDFHHSSCWKLS